MNTPQKETNVEETTSIPTTTTPEMIIVKPEEPAKTKFPIQANKNPSLTSPYSPYMLFNAASYVDGARVDLRESSGTSSLKAFLLERDQSGYVLFERDDLPEGKAWCSSEQQPVLTIHLSKNITPIAVSYQHTKWYKTVPFGAPKAYDVYGCQRFYCDKRIPLVSNCQYEMGDQKGTEQLCYITANLYDTIFDTVQFRFHQNHGNVNMTCAYSIRVYGEKRTPKYLKQPVENRTLCSSIAWDYKNRPFFYSMRTKNCETLYSNKCCGYCPQCCRDCEMNDFSFQYIINCIVVFVLFLICFVIPCFALCHWCYQGCPEQRR